MKHLHRIVAVWSVVSLLLAGCSKSESSEPPTQQADRIVLTDGESSRDFSAEGGTWQIDFDASADWTAEQVIPIAVQWYHFTPRRCKAGAGSVTVTVLPDTTDEARNEPHRAGPRDGERAHHSHRHRLRMMQPRVNPKGDNTHAEEVSAY